MMKEVALYTGTEMSVIQFPDGTPDELRTIVAESKAPDKVAVKVIDSFSIYAEGLLSKIAEAKKIKVTDENDNEGMKHAHNVRMEFANARVAMEKVRKRIKDNALAEGTLIDTTARTLKGYYDDAESYLKTQEDFAKMKKQEREDALRDERIAIVEPFFADGFAKPNAIFEVFGTMPAEEFEVFRTSAEAAYQIREAERINKEEEAARIVAENERLKQEAALREEELQKERNAKALLEQAAAAKKAQEEETAKAEREAEVQKQIAPDREKIARMAQEINKICNEFESLGFVSEFGRDARDVAIRKLEAIAQELQEKGGEI